MGFGCKESQFFGASDILKNLDQSSPSSAFFIDLKESNYLPLYSLSNSWGIYCVVTTGLLKGYIVFISTKGHGDELAFPSVSSLIDYIVLTFENYEMQEEMFFEGYTHYKRTNVRSQEEISLGKRLIVSEDDSNWIYAAYLLSDKEAEEWLKLLDTEHFLRREVIERLNHIGTDEARTILSIDRGQYDEFANLLVDKLKNRGVESEYYDGNYLKVKGHHFILDYLYYKRNKESLDQASEWITSRI